VRILFPPSTPVFSRKGLSDETVRSVVRDCATAIATYDILVQNPATPPKTLTKVFLPRRVRLSVNKDTFYKAWKLLSIDTIIEPPKKVEDCVLAVRVELLRRHLMTVCKDIGMSYAKARALINGQRATAYKYLDSYLKVDSDAHKAGREAADRLVAVRERAKICAMTAQKPAPKTLADRLRFIKSNQDARENAERMDYEDACSRRKKTPVEAPLDEIERAAMSRCFPETPRPPKPARNAYTPILNKPLTKQQTEHLQRLLAGEPETYEEE
jgi:hypothetical protein